MEQEGGNSPPSCFIDSNSQDGLAVCDTVSGCIGIISSRNEETAVPCPYNVILGRDTALPSPLYHSGVTGNDMIPNSQFPIPNPQFPIPNSQFPIPNS
jgi:hypothetical protein